MRILIILALIAICGYLWDYEHKCHKIPEGDAKITVTMVDGNELYPLRAYAAQDNVQLIMPDGRAITMAWAQVDIISSN